MKLKFNYFVFVLSRIVVENRQLYTARSRPDNRDIRITDGRITEVQLYLCMNKEKVLAGFCPLITIISSFFFSIVK